MQLKPVIQSAFDLAENTSDKSKVRLVGIVHVQPHLLNDVDKVRSCQGEILESTCQTPVVRRVSNQRIIQGRQLGLSVNRSRQGVIVGHTGTLKKLGSVLVLREEKILR